MKLKTWHLFLCVAILFGCSFYVVNLRFDKFYRVNGINNDNRVLLEKYLDKSEQTYLIDNQISIELFIDYLKEDDFILANYQYYNALKETGRYSQKNVILETGNSLATRLEYLYSDHAVEQARILIQNSLENAFLNNENFRFDYMSIYTYLQPLYDNNDYSFIDDAQIYVDRLHEMHITRQEDVEKRIQMLTRAYTKESLSALMNEQLSHEVEIVFNPYELSTLVDQKHYIGYYEPIDLLLLQDIPRLRYTMYLQKDAYLALINMYQDLSQISSGFLLREAYSGPQSLDEKDIGYQESQLGLTIAVTQSQTPYNQFENTDMSKWLEEHAYEYGFILRYPKNKASLTGHTYDAHIYRYVGKALAKSLYDSQLTLEEYHQQGLANE